MGHPVLLRSVDFWVKSWVKVAPFVVFALAVQNFKLSISIYFCHWWSFLSAGHQLSQCHVAHFPALFEDLGVLETSAATNHQSTKCPIISFQFPAGAEFLALKHESMILRQDECPRILLSCYRARNSGPKSHCITSEFVDVESEMPHSVCIRAYFFPKTALK